MIQAFLNGVELPRLEVPFLKVPIENAVDVEVLSGNLYTDYVSLNERWEMSWDSLTEDEYNTIRAIYESQFSTGDYPLLDIPYYDTEDVPVRMTINTKDIWNDCGSIQNVTITLRETAQETS